MVLARGGAGGGKFGKSSGLIRVIDPGIGVNGFAGKEGTGLVGFSGGGGGGGGCDGAIGGKAATSGVGSGGDGGFTFNWS